MGLRRETDALVLATLPAGAGREAGEAHVRFNADAQAVASRILRQADRRLTILGIVHTHPGSLRRPSGGDFEGDRRWVPLLRGQQGVFGIGTADAPADDLADWVAIQPKEHVQYHQGLRFSWYALATGDADYRSLPVVLTLGPDLALPLWPLWPVIEMHAARIERLAQSLARLRFDLPEDDETALQLSVPGPNQSRLAARLSPDRVSYGWLNGGGWRRLDPPEPARAPGGFLLPAPTPRRGSSHRRSPPPASRPSAPVTIRRRAAPRSRPRPSTCAPHRRRSRPRPPTPRAARTAPRSPR